MPTLLFHFSGTSTNERSPRQDTITSSATMAQGRVAFISRTTAGLLLVLGCAVVGMLLLVVETLPYRLKQNVASSSSAGSTTAIGNNLRHVSMFSTPGRAYCVVAPVETSSTAAIARGARHLPCLGLDGSIQRAYRECCKNRCTMDTWERDRVYCK